MKFEFEQPNKQARQTYKYIIYAIIILVISLFQDIFLHFIEIGGVTPDLLIIFCVWITLKEGPFIGLFFGFGSGLLLDIISYDVIGTNALAKTVVCFAAGFFYRENQTEIILSSSKFLIIVSICSVVHNIIYFFFYIKSNELSFFPFAFKYIIAFTIYTGVISIIVILAHRTRKKIKI